LDIGIERKLFTNFEFSKLFYFIKSGVLLFPWHVRYFDNTNKKEEKLKTNKKDSNLKTHSNKTYYQALMDNRDTPFIVKTKKL
jgi:hypothetical protein